MTDEIKVNSKYTTTVEEILDMIKRGWTYQDMAEEWDCDLKTVWAVRKKAGVIGQR